MAHQAIATAAEGGTYRADGGQCRPTVTTVALPPRLTVSRCLCRGHEPFGAARQDFVGLVELRRARWLAEAYLARRHRPAERFVHRLDGTVQNFGTVSRYSRLSAHDNLTSIPMS
jgi:hypothetical protein